MTYNELIKNIALEMNLPQLEVKGLLKAFTDTVSESLNDGSVMDLPDFGTFSVEKIDEKIDFNPKTGTKTLYPPKLVVKYEVSENLNL